MLRIGEQRDLLVAVRVDTSSALERVRRLFGPWIELDAPPELADEPPAFSLVLDGVGGLSAEPRRLRSVPQLRYGSVVMARSRQSDAMLHALAGVLGGAHVHQVDDHRLWTAIRLFVRGNSAVLVEADRPALVSDRILAGCGVVEWPVWSMLVVGDASVSVPPPLPDLDWRSVDLQPPDGSWCQLELAGIAGIQSNGGVAADFVVELARRSVSGRWFNLVTSMMDTGKLVTAVDAPTLRHHVRTLLGA